MSPRRSDWLIWLAAIVFVLGLFFAQDASAMSHKFDRGPRGGGGDEQILDPPGGPGGGGGDGGDPDEFFLSVGPTGPTVIADDGEDRVDAEKEPRISTAKALWWLVDFLLLIR